MSEWLIEFEGFDPGHEGHRETLCTLGNGVFATRGAAPEAGADGVHYPGTYAAGLFNRLASEVEGVALEHESMVNLPNWLPLTVRPAGGRWVDLTAQDVTGYRAVLDLRRGVLTRAFRVTDDAGRTTSVGERRFVHMASPHRAALEWTVVAENWSGPMEILSGIDGSVENRNVADELALAGRHLRTVATGESAPERVWLEAETVHSHVRVAVACRTRVEGGGDREPTSRPELDDPDRVGHLLTLETVAGQPVRIEKVATVFTGLDRAISEPLGAALTELDHVGGFDDELARHVLTWEHLWRRCHLELSAGDAGMARTLNLHVFHVLQVLSPHTVDRDVGVPARGLHGEGYRGHIFWDDLFVFPFLNLRIPDLTRALLVYRHRRLPAARRAARAMGARGARYPWQSGSDGREETPTQFFNPSSGRWMRDSSRRQHHVSLAVAYNLWHYYQVSADRDFLAAYGGEMLVEISRFWVDLAERDADSDRYHLRGVMGPDEFHDGYPDRPGEGVDDNAYTNVMVSWLLRRALEAHEVLSDHHSGQLWERLSLSTDELETWDRVSRRLFVPIRSDGVIDQFSGYADLEELDWDGYRSRYANIGRLDLILEAEDDTTNRYQASKQADALMLFFLFSAEELGDLFAHLGYPFDPATIPRTIDYYLARTSDGSTLSRVAHAWVLARSDRPGSWKVFQEALASDLDDIQGGTTREGVHLGAMAGTIDLVQRGYTGIEVRDDVLWFNPRLPEELDALSFSLRYRGHSLDVSIAERHLRVTARPCAAAPIAVGLTGEVTELGPGESVEVDLGERDGEPTRALGESR